MQVNRIEYLGDGLYLYFDDYGWELRANDPVMPTDVVYLEPEVMASLIQRVSSRSDNVSEV